MVFLLTMLLQIFISLLSRAALDILCVHTVFPASLLLSCIEVVGFVMRS